MNRSRGVAKTALRTNFCQLQDFANFARVRLQFDAGATRRVGGPYLLEGGQDYYAVLVTSNWDEVEGVVDGAFPQVNGHRHRLVKAITEILALLKGPSCAPRKSGMVSRYTYPQNTRASTEAIKR
jgi:hypothetical protein